MSEPFQVMDCALIAIATGEQAQNLRELRDRLVTTAPRCIYYHFWGGLLRPRFDDPEFQNDFAAWSSHALHDTRLAERLAIIDPTVYPEIEDLRREVIEVVEERLEESEMVPWARSGHQFHFIRSQIVIFDTTLEIASPRELPEVIPHLSLGSVFYHFIDARRRTPSGTNDFSQWLMGWGASYAPIVQALTEIDPYFVTLSELREELKTAVRDISLMEASA